MGWTKHRNRCSWCESVITVSLEKLYCHTFWEYFFMFLWVDNIFSCLGSCVSYIFLSITYFCSSAIYRGRNSDLQSIVSMLLCRAFERSNNPYLEPIMEPGVSKDQKEILSMCVWVRRKYWKRIEAMKKGVMSWKRNLCICACVWEKKNSFEITVINSKAYKKC